MPSQPVIVHTTALAAARKKRRVQCRFTYKSVLVQCFVPLQQVTYGAISIFIAVSTVQMVHRERTVYRKCRYITKCVVDRKYKRVCHTQWHKYTILHKLRKSLVGDLFYNEREQHKIGIAIMIYAVGQRICFGLMHNHKVEDI